MYGHTQHTSIQAIKQPSRRRTRRHQQRLRSVEVTRGRSGYGFTISGQSPCILSCIVAGSPADRCGLKTGDFLISVNGQLISESPHDDVVRLIGSSRGMLLLQIAENYNTSDSSEDEFQVRPKVNSRSKVRSRGYERSLDDLEALVRHRHASQPQGKYARDRSLDYAHNTRRALSPPPAQENGIENIHPQHVRNVSALKSVQDGVIRYKNGSRTKHTIITREARLGLAKSQSHPEGFTRPLPPTPLSEMNNGLQVNSEPRSRSKKSWDLTFDAKDYERAVVGYAGSIEMPRDLTHSRVQAVRGAVRRLRLEQKVHAFVLMELESSSLKLINHMSCTVADYPPDKLAFAGVCPDDQRFFGLVTLHTSDDSDGERMEVVGSSCHVFFVDPSLALHHLHMSQIENFSIRCTTDPRTQTCAEFPSCAPSLVHAICARYPCAERSRYAAGMEQIGTFVAVPPQDRAAAQEPKPMPSKVCVVEVDTPDTSMNASALSSFSQFSRSSYAEDSDLDSKLQVRAMPNPRGFTSEASPLEQQNSANNLRRNLHRLMNGQAPPPRDSQTHVRPVSQLSMPPLSMSTPVDRPFSKPPMVPRTPQVTKERSKSTPPIMKPGSRPIDTPREDNLTDDHKRQLTPQPPEFPVKKTSAEDLSTWRSAADLDEPSVVNGSASARPSSEDSKSRVTGWAVNFDLLLQDTAGLATFTEYLKKEYSEENIMFWKKCREYANTKDQRRRSEMGQAIFREHLSSCASEPVNVDSRSRSEAEESLSKSASNNVFEQTQKQIFLLMKQDSYPRFLKSEIYKQCILAEMENLPLPYTGDEKTPAKLEVPSMNETPVTAESKKNMKKSKSSSGADTGEEKRRRSLLPWIRNKSEKKLMKAVTDSELNRTDTKSVKVQLPDGVWTAMEFKGHRWTEALRAHCEANALLYEFLIITADAGEAISIKAETCADQIHLHKAVVFKLEMATRKTVGLKCLPDRTLHQVLSPILSIYGQSMDSNTVIHVSGTGVVLDDQAEIGAFDGKHLVVQSLDDFKEWGGVQRGSAKPPLPKGRVKDKALGTLFKDISSVAFDEHGIWDPDLKHAKSGEKNSTFLDFIRRNSIGEKGDSGRVRKTSAHHGSQKSLNQQKPLSASKKKPLPLTADAPRKKGLGDDQERFLSLLSRTSRQMDDQRGLTPKDLELPDFLKVDKTDCPSSKKPSIHKSTFHHSDPSLHKVNITPQHQISCSQDFLDTSLAHSDNSFSSAGTVPTHDEADRYFSDLSTTGLMHSQGSFADYLNLTATDHLGSDEECDITLIPPSSSSSSSSRANSPPPPSSSSQSSWNPHPLPSSSEDRSTPSPTTHSLILDPSDSVSFV